MLRVRGIASKMAGLLGAPGEAERRRAAANNFAEVERALNALLPCDAFGPWMSEDEKRVAGCVTPDDGMLRLTQDTVRRQHMSLLLGLAQWQPGQPVEELVELAGRAKALADLSHALEEIVRRAGKKEESKK